MITGTASFPLPHPPLLKVGKTQKTTTAKNNSGDRLYRLLRRRIHPSSMAFWGALVRYDQPLTLLLHGGPYRRLRITKAVLASSRKNSMYPLLKTRNALFCKVGENPEVCVCCLRFIDMGMCHLDLEFKEPDSIVFSIVGDRDFHISGYYFDEYPPGYPVTPPIADFNREQVVTSGERLALESRPQDDPLIGGQHAPMLEAPAHIQETASTSGLKDDNNVGLQKVDKSAIGVDKEIEQSEDLVEENSHPGDQERIYSKEIKARKRISGQCEMDEENLQSQTNKGGSAMADYHPDECQRLKGKKKRKLVATCDQELHDEVSQKDLKDSACHVTNEQEEEKPSHEETLDLPSTVLLLSDTRNAGKIKKKKSKTKQVVVPVDTKEGKDWYVSVEPLQSQLISVRIENIEWTIVASLPAFGTPKRNLGRCEEIRDPSPIVSSPSNAQHKGEFKKKRKKTMQTELMDVQRVHMEDKIIRCFVEPATSGSVDNMNLEIVQALPVDRNSKLKHENQEEEDEEE